MGREDSAIINWPGGQGRLLRGDGRGVEPGGGRVCQIEGREGVPGSGNGRSKWWERRKLKAGLGQSGGPRWVGLEALGEGQRIDLPVLRSPNVILRTLGKMERWASFGV